MIKKSAESNINYLTRKISELNDDADKIKDTICPMCVFNEIQYDGVWCASCGISGYIDIQFREKSVEF